MVEPFVLVPGIDEITETSEVAEQPEALVTCTLNCPTVLTEYVCDVTPVLVNVPPVIFGLLYHK